MNKTPGVTYFAETDARNKRVPFGIKDDDRSRHMYLIGKTGMGKSTVLENMTIQDIENGNGLAFIDPHGKTADLFLEYIPEHRIKDVVYFAPFDTSFPISFNVMEDVGADKRHLVSNGLMSAFKKIWVDAWSARMEYILNNIMLALLEYPDSTLIGVNRMLADKDYRKKVVENVTDPSVKAFWNDEFAKYSDKYMQEAGAAIQNKIGQFIANPLVRNIIGQPKSNLDLRKIMDDKKILIINLSKGRMGEANANLLGSMIITKIYLAAMSRADRTEKELSKLPNFYLYVDEFQNFANESFADILSEARKYKLNLTVAHQYIEQMSEEVRAAVFGNVGTMMTFRVGAYDAEVLEKEFAPQFTIEDLVSLGRFQSYLKLMINGVTSPPFSATTLPPFDKPIVSYAKEIVDYSRATYAKPRSAVEDEIKTWHEPIININEKRSSPQPQATQQPQYTQQPQTRPQPSREAQRETPREAPREALRRQPEAQVPQRHQEVVKTEYRAERRPPPAHQPFKQLLGSDPHQPTDPAQEAREVELRKAMSLNYLRPVEPSKKEQQFNKKKPTPENISALKDALLSVIGDVEKGDIKEEIPQPEKREYVPPEPTSSPAPTPSPQPVSQQPAPPPPPPPPKSSIKEIPEEQLRKMLEVE